jgi:acetyl-CoA acetyltransferase
MNSARLLVGGSSAVLGGFLGTSIAVNNRTQLNKPEATVPEALQVSGTFVALGAALGASGARAVGTPLKAVAAGAGKGALALAPLAVATVGAAAITEAVQRRTG